MRWSSLAWVAGLAVLSGCGAEQPAAPKTFDVRGVLELRDADSQYYIESADQDCYGQGGYDDIHDGAQVVIRDSKGEQVALGSLGAGKSAPLTEIVDGLYVCHFPITVEDVPEAGTLYTVEVAGRGEISFKRDEAEAIAMTIG